MKKLILLLAIIIVSLNLYSQARINYVLSKDTFEIIINGTESHTFTVGKHQTDTSEVDIILYKGSDISNSFAPLSEGVTNGDTHDHIGGDGAQINHTGLSNIGTNSHTAIDGHISDASNPHGSTLTQTTINAGTATVSSSIYTSQGNITNTATTVILDTYEEDNGIWLLTFSGEHTDFSSAFFGYGAYIISRCRNTYTSQWQTYFIKMFDESYSNRVVVSQSNDDIRLQSNLADSTYPLRWRILRLR